jgi:hypothetical protein
VGNSLPLTPEDDDGRPWPQQGYREHAGPWVRADNGVTPIGAKNALKTTAPKG